MLFGKKIFLRYLEPPDADVLHQWENDKSHWNVTGTQKPFTKKEIKSFISNQKDIYLDKQLGWMICTPPISPLSPGRGIGGEVGCIDLFEFNKTNLTAGIGILVDKNHRRNGYGSEALSLLVTYSFEILNLKQLYCNISADNTASMNLFQKHKFKTVEKKKEAHLLVIARNRVTKQSPRKKE